MVIGITILDLCSENLESLRIPVQMNIFTETNNPSRSPSTGAVGKFSATFHHVLVPGDVDVANKKDHDNAKIGECGFSNRFQHNNKITRFKTGRISTVSYRVLAPTEPATGGRLVPAYALLSIQIGKNCAQPQLV